MRSAAARPTPLSTWVYRSAVMAVLACPSRSEMVVDVQGSGVAP